MDFDSRSFHIGVLITVIMILIVLFSTLLCGRATNNKTDTNTTTINIPRDDQGDWQQIDFHIKVH